MRLRVSHTPRSDTPLSSCLYVISPIGTPSSVSCVAYGLHALGSKTTPASITPDPSTGEGGPMSGGFVALIVIMSIVGAVAVGGAFVYLRRRRQFQRLNQYDVEDMGSGMLPSAMSSMGVKWGSQQDGGGDYSSLG